MKSFDRFARTAGILYIIGTVTGVLSLVFTGPVREAPDLLMYLSMQGSQLLLGALCVLAMGLALALVPVAVFPVLKKKHSCLAVGYLVFRGGLETFTYLITVLSWLFLLSFSRMNLHAGALEPGNFQRLGELLLEGDTVSFLTTMVFIPGALMFYYALYQSRLVPGWLSGWGLLSSLPYLVAAFLVVFGLIGHMSTLDAVLRIPLGLQEMVLAVWLISKGFNIAEVETSTPTN